MSDDEELGGDPPCWAHLFGEDADEARAGPDAPGEVVDLAALAARAGAAGAVWGQQSADLAVNLVVFSIGDGVAAHINSEVDVLLVGITGEGAVEIDGARRLLRARQALLIPKGASRAIQSRSDPFAYLSCHRRRAGIWPTV